MKVKIVRSPDEVEVEEVLERTAKPYGKEGCHITLPKKYIGYTVLVMIKTKTGQWIKGFKKSLDKMK